MLTESRLQITNFHYYHNECWHVSCTGNAVAPSNAAWGCLKKAFHPHSRTENSNQRVCGGAAVYTPWDPDVKNHNRSYGWGFWKGQLSSLQSTRHPFSLQGCRHFCHCCLLPPPCCGSSPGKADTGKQNLSDSDDYDNEASMNAVMLKMWSHQMILYCWELKQSGLWHAENLEGHWAIFQGQTATQWLPMEQFRIFWQHFLFFF